MKASEARELMLNKPSVELSNIYKDIKIRAKAGYDYDMIYHFSLTPTQIKELLDNGYNVEIKNGDYKIRW